MLETDLLLEQVRQQKARDKKGRDAGKADQLLKKLFPAQYDFVTDESRRKVALCPRRAGKSFCNLVYALIVALKRQDARILVLARTRRQARAIYWGKLKKLCEELEIKPHFRNMDLECHLRNGSVVMFAGADTTEEIDKYRGDEFDLVIIDEGKSYSQRLMDELVFDVLRPALLDRRGTLSIIGTPGAVISGLFWALTTAQKSYRPAASDRAMGLRVYPWWERKNGEKPAAFNWSLHKWTAKDNTAKPWIWSDAVEEKESNGWADTEPFWVREYLGEWVPDDSALVYAYHKAVPDSVHWRPADSPNDRGPHGLPKGDRWRFILGIDLGWHDSTAFVVAAWSPQHKALYYVHAEKHAYMIPEYVAGRVKELEAIYGGFDVRVVDTGGGGSKQLAEGLRATYGIKFEPALKTEKVAHIAMFNSDLMTGRIKVNPEGSGGILVDEWKTVQWEDADHTKVDKGCDDHASDAAVYVWRYAHHHWAKEVVQGPTADSDEYWKEYKRNERQQLREQRQPRKWWTKYSDKMNQLPQAVQTLNISKS